MQILLSPAKDMTATPTLVPPFLSVPPFQDDAVRNALQMGELSAEEIGKLLKVNPQIAALNKQRYQEFLDPPVHAAVLSYTGMSFRHLKAETFSEEDLRYAQEHLWITSFLYGLNRPLDGIKTYRMEGNVVLPEHDGLTMFRFWRTRLTDVLIDAVKNDDGVLFNLASAEMKQLFDWKRVEQECQVISPDFRVMKNGQLKTVVVYAKMMRGAMTRHLITQRITLQDNWKDFEYEGFSFLPDSSDTQPIWAIL